MKFLKHTALLLLVAIAAACQNKDIEIADPIVAPVDAATIQGRLEGDDYVWTWKAPEGLRMQVSICTGRIVNSTDEVEGNTFVHRNIETNVEFTYIFKLTDGANISRGVTKHYMREGASPVSGISMSQVDKEGGYDAMVKWTPSPDAESVKFAASNGSRTVEASLAADADSYLIENVKDGEEWSVTITAGNGKGLSLPVSASLRIGKTAIGFLSEYPTVEELLADGDDDEA